MGKKKKEKKKRSSALRSSLSVSFAKWMGRHVNGSSAASLRASA